MSALRNSQRKQVVNSLLLRTFRFGFAAGCEATALPRRKLRSSIGAVPLVRVRLLNTQRLGLSPNQGHSPKSTAPVTATQSLRLTSGGEAESEARFFWRRPISAV